MIKKGVLTSQRGSEGDDADHFDWFGICYGERRCLD